MNSTIICCKNKNCKESCTTDGLCFYAFGDDSTFNGGCIAKKLLVPVFKPFPCQSSPGVVIKCCNEDRCNNITKAEFDRSRQHDVTIRLDVSTQTLIGVTVVLFLAIVLFISLFIKKKRAKMSKSSSMFDIFKKIFNDTNSDSAIVSGVSSCYRDESSSQNGYKVHNYFNTCQKVKDDRLFSFLPQTYDAMTRKPNFCTSSSAASSSRTRKKKLFKTSLFKKSTSLNNSCQPSTVSNTYLTNSGSGAGEATFSQVTVSRQIQLCNVVDSGHFGEVWLGRWCSQNVAVKIFSTREEQSWSRECYIYQTSMLRHDNILGFIASDNHDSGICNQLWIVTDYYSNGSLYDYLRRVPIDQQMMKSLCFSLVNGLAHLHMTIIGLRGKPAIAHRDLKSRNILIKNDGKSCCIADFGLAVQYIENKIDIAPNHRVGTVRYMAPEILENKTIHSFESYKQADMYALSLCFWEIWYAYKYAGKFTNDDIVPYFKQIPHHPNIEEMHQIVVVDETRPPILLSNQETCLQTGLSKEIIKIIMECWDKVPESRLTSLRVKSTICNIVI